MAKKAIYWFRNDLRLNDNPGLDRALREAEEVIPVFVFDDWWWDQDNWGLVKTGPFRTKFLLESVADLQTELRKLGVELQLFKGDTVKVLKDLSSKHQTKTVYGQQEHTQEEFELEQAIAESLTLHLEEGFTLYHPEDIPMDIQDLPDIFTQFRKKVEKYAKVRELKAAPTTWNTSGLDACELPTMADFGQTDPSLDPRAVLEFKGGASEAKARMDHYFWKTKKLSVYKKTRNGLIGADYSSKFSPWLANGCISPREIYWEIKKYEAQYESNESTYWLIFELIWRDYFRFVAMKYDDRIFWKAGIKGRAPKWRKDKRLLAQWAEGRTQDEFVNANMRELAKTGFMSNRGRQNVASYLVHDLGVDWRLGASLFEHFLIDYDPCSNYGNWIYVAGVGNDPRPNRKFNTQLQADRYDTNGKYRSRWSNEVLELNL
ncbi:DASH family cryptochrome [Sanyastnella coralliicola]|uniref:DASH family cryptochrome n=1 Tax=Sanyastnella coralliicola TaxID=3069118 RepID=UPI0027B92D28|nr:DASH family cryptochrome [Longitalea sp. SCSIO 12813]